MRRTFSKMAATTSLVSYDSDSEDEEKTSDLGDNEEHLAEKTVNITSLKSKFLLDSAPAVTAKVILN